MTERVTADEHADTNTGTTRRRFVTFLVAAPTLTVAGRWLGEGTARAQVANLSVPELDIAAALQPEVDAVTPLMRLRVTEDNRVVFEAPRAEVGQGINTAVAMLIAEDIDARLVDVDMPHSDARPELGAAQLTGASTTMRNMWGPARRLAAEARARLVTAAAQRWGLNADSLTTRDTHVFAPDGRSTSYGSLAVDARNVAVPAVSPLPKPVSEHTLVGTPTPRTDGKELITGRATYTLDVDVPGALPTVVARPPTIGGTVSAIDNAAQVRAMPGVVAVVTIPTGVAVVATTFHHAQQARAALSVSWGPGPIADLSDADIRGRLQNATDPLLAPSLLQSTVDGEFDFAFVNHGPLETNCAIADVRADSAEVWVASKIPPIAQTVVATGIGLPRPAVTVHPIRGGGSFGRKLYPDAALEAAQVSHRIGEPVKLLWTRDDDVKHGRMRPASHHKMRFLLTAGIVDSFENRSAAAQLDMDLTPFGVVLDAGIDLPTSGASFYHATQATPYKFGVTTKSLNEVQLDVPTAFWRSVYSGHNRAAEEIMVDRLASRLRKDPMRFRIDMASNAEAIEVLRQLKSRGNWGRSLPSGWAQGVGFHSEYNAHIGCLAEIDATNPDAPRVTRTVIVVDMGLVVNPAGAEAQFQGGVIDGITTILLAGNHITNGAVVESSYADFKVAKQANSPLEFEAHFLNTGRETGGAGELAVPAAAAAVANAYARATGTSPSRFPINF